ncbi:hypothetical protein FHS44_006374 [Streptosporangium saharense]|uniref:Uncharacterized protein n=1 Tax=Streptosporangium saharense TaxID=1706840 RepID=A0A7W7QSZ2_9ACTN|nr:hypothetical protein [Streptosporangium saharense]
MAPSRSSASASPQFGQPVTGAWVYPGGGGYESTMTRI